MSQRAHPRDASTKRVRRSHRLVVAAAAGFVGLLAATDAASAQLPLHDAVAVPEYRYTGDAKDHPRFAAPSERSDVQADVKDHPRYRQVREQPLWGGDVKDHAGYGDRAGASGGLAAGGVAENHAAMYGEHTDGMRRASTAGVGTQSSISVALFW